jgi:hypothetical protein
MAELLQISRLTVKKTKLMRNPEPPLKAKATCECRSLTG